MVTYWMAPRISEAEGSENGHHWKTQPGATAYATVRLDMSWGVVETAKGEYDGFGFYDA